MDGRTKDFWQSIIAMRLRELRDAAIVIFDGWAERDCEDDALNFAEALSDYAYEQLENDEPRP